MGESIVYALKIALAIACALAFFGAIMALVGILLNLGSTSIFGEIVGVVSVYLPFQPAVVFGTILTCMNAILAFLVGRKIYHITNSTYQAS